MVNYELTHLSIHAGSAFGGGGRDLANWEVIAIGGLAGALASIATTPADVLKTRIMTAAATESINAGALLVSAQLRHVQLLGSTYMHAWHHAVLTCMLKLSASYSACMRA
jgi:hypothetical protein